MSWRDHVRAPLREMSAYHVPPARCAIKLDANESPWPLSERAQRAIEVATAALPLHRYPDAGAIALKGALAKRLGVTTEALVLGNGSDELIAMLCGAFGEPSDGRPARVLFPSPTFVMYRHEALSHGLLPVEVPLGPDFAADADALLSAVRAERPSLIFLSTPNNPTGTVWPRPALQRILDESGDALVIIDEAYGAYGEEASCLPLVAAHERCVVMQTLSKIGLAGLRVGYLVVQPAIKETIEKVRPPYNLDQLSQAAATALLEVAGAELDAHVAAVKAERARIEPCLRAYFEVFPSGGNFFLVRHPEAARIDAQLRGQGVAVRCFDRGPGQGPLAGCLRITIGTPVENDALLRALATTRDA